MITIDFETRSEIDLVRVGAHVYSQHSSTVVSCMAFAFDDQEAVHLWHPAFPGLFEHRPRELEELFDRIALGEPVEAHNAFFERCHWRHVLCARYGWIDVSEKQWRCSAAKAAAHALPRSLDDATRALGLSTLKDGVGSRLAIKMSKPRRPRKAELRRAGTENAEQFYAKHGPLWHEEPADLERLFAYCQQDVRAERALSRALRDLSPDELATWQLDQQINLRGVYCDREMARAALRHARKASLAANHEVREITAGLVARTTKRAEVLDWMRSEGFELAGTSAPVMDAFLAREDLSEPVRRVAELVRRTNRTSTRKYAAMLGRVDADGRLRDTLRYHGSSTGRWAGGGKVQPHNYPRGFGARDPSMDEVCEAIRTLDVEALAILYGDPMEVLSKALRGALCASPGHELLVADYAAIEARGTFWLAGDEAALEALRRSDAGEGPDVYKYQASLTYGKPPNQITPTERQMGKVQVLGLGYQMGARKFVANAATYGIVIDEPTAKGLVDAYRRAHPQVVRLWYDLERAAVEAVRRGDGASPVPCGKTLWGVRGRFLHCRLPSGRLLSYCDPKFLVEPTPWGEDAPKLHFQGIDTYTHKWSDQTTYGGKLTENVVQALCRDLLRDAMHRLEAHGYRVVLTVHDEIVAEVAEGDGDLREFEAGMAVVPSWARGMPIAATGYRARRYRK